MKSTSRDPPSIDDFFVLHPTMASQYYWAQTTSDPSDLGAIARGEHEPDEPIQLAVSTGAVAADFIWNSHTLVVASGRVVDLLRSRAFVGWKTYPVEVRAKQGVLAGYSGIAILGRAGPIDEKRSRVKWSKPDADGRRAILGMRGLYFDVSSWDGSDLFTVGEGISAQVTRRVVEAFRSAKVTNCKFERVGGYSFGSVD